MNHVGVDTKNTEGTDFTRRSLILHLTCVICCATSAIRNQLRRRTEQNNNFKIFCAVPVCGK